MTQQDSNPVDVQEIRRVDSRKLDSTGSTGNDKPTAVMTGVTGGVSSFLNGIRATFRQDNVIVHSSQHLKNGGTVRKSGEKQNDGR